MVRNKSSLMVAVGGVLVFGILATAQLRHAPTPLPQRFTAVALSTGGPRSNAVAENLEITVNRWSADAELQRLTQAMSKGQDQLLDVLRDLKPVGTIQVPGHLAYDLHYAHEVSSKDGGRRIFLATDRPITVWEAVNRPRTIDYPFTFIRLQLDEEGNGQGTLSLATRVIVDEDVVEFERYTAQPIELNHVMSTR